MLWEFEGYRLDAAQRVLLRGGEVVSLTPKVFDTLLALVESRGRVLEKDELLKTIWPDTFVEEGSLARSVSTLRKALGDKADGEKYIQTIPKRGYRFVAAVREVELHEVVDEKSAPAPEAVRVPSSAVNRKIMYGVAGLLLVLAAAWAGYRYNNTKPVERPVHSLIVLPFVNLSSQHDSEFFSDGLTEEVIDAVARIPNLRVIARTTSSQYKGKAKDIRQVGQEVNADAVLEGSVRRQGDRLRITAQLNNAKDGYHFWSETWERDRKDVFAVQQEIASMVAKGIGAAKAAPLAGPKPPTSDMDAYDAYLRGVYFRAKVGVALPKAVTELEHAVKLDPNFAAAYAHLADVYNDLGYTFEMPPQAAYPIAKRYANQALRIDPALAEGQGALGWVSTFHDWDWTTAEKAFHQAILLNPADSWAHHNYSHLLVALNRMREAIAESQRAVEIDPLGARVRGHMAWLYRMTRQPELAIREALNTLEIAPDDLSTHVYLSEAYEAVDQFENAIKVMEGLMPPEFLQAERDGFRKSGKNGYNNTRLSWCLHQPGGPGMLKSPHFLAALYARLGRADEAFRELERGMKERDPWLVYLNVDPFYDNIRSDARFKEVVRRIGLPK